MPPSLRMTWDTRQERGKMEGINQAYEILLTGAMIVLAVLIVLSLIRSILGPGIPDRIIAVNMTGTMIILSRLHISEPTRLRRIAVSGVGVE